MYYCLLTLGRVAGCVCVLLALLLQKYKYYWYKRTNTDSVFSALQAACVHHQAAVEELRRRLAALQARMRP
jgi:hypothetical protein